MHRDSLTEAPNDGRHRPAVASESAQQDARRWLARSWEAVHPYGSGGVSPNFADPELTDGARAYYGVNSERIHRIRRLYDPDSCMSLTSPQPSDHGAIAHRRLAAAARSHARPMSSALRCGQTRKRRERTNR